MHGYNQKNELVSAGRICSEDWTRRRSKNADVTRDKAKNLAEYESGSLDILGVFLSTNSRVQKEMILDAVLNARRNQFNSANHTRFFTSLYYFVRPLQHLLRNRQTDLLSGFEIDEKLKFRRLLHRQVSGLGAFENLIDVLSGAPE